MKPVHQAWCMPLLAAGLLLLPRDLAAIEEPPLPTWDPTSEEGASFAPGSSFTSLLPGEGEGHAQGLVGGDGDAVAGFYLGSPVLAGSAPLLLDGAGVTPRDLALFLRGGLEAAGQEQPRVIPTPAAALREVPGPVLDLLGRAAPDQHVIDPQALLEEPGARDLERVLRFHASEARIRLYILVLERGQNLSDLARLDPLVRRLYTDRETCLAVYPLGEPWRARLLVSQGVRQSSPVAALTEMAEDCRTDALLAQDAGQQLQRFAVRLSTRLFWLEKHLPAPGPATGAALHEVGAKAAGGTVAWLRAAVSSVGRAGGGVGGLAVVVGLVFLLRLGRGWWRARGAGHVWMLPETEVPPRLGGAFSGGAGAMIRYGGEERAGE